MSVPEQVLGQPSFLTRSIAFVFDLTPGRRGERCLAQPTVGRLRNYAEKTVWSQLPASVWYQRDLYNAATSRTLP